MDEEEFEIYQKSKYKEKGHKLKTNKDFLNVFTSLKKQGSNIDDISDMLLLQKDKLIDIALKSTYNLRVNCFKDKFILASILQKKKFRKPKETQYIRKFFS